MKGIMDADANICAVILNYNDAQTTRKLAESWKDSKAIRNIIIVDNCSTDDSWEKLGEFKEEFASDNSNNSYNSNNLDKVQLHLFRTTKNGGYGSGNQAGIDYAAEYLEPDYIVIANPDVQVSDACILRVADALDKQEDGAVASAMVVDVKGQPSFSYWDLQSVWLDLLDTGLVTRRLFRSWLKTPLEKLPVAADGVSRMVGALPGSFFMVKTGCFTPGDLKELFDKHVFLYYEEKILGQKLKKMGLKELLVTDAYYVHAHSVSIDKSYNKISDKQKLLHKSKLYYYEHYLELGGMKLAVAKAFLAVVLAEVKFLTGVLKMRW